MQITIKENDDLISLYPEIDRITQALPITVRKIQVLGVNADKYTVRKVVGYIENLGFQVSWKETYTDTEIVKNQLTGV